MKKYALLSLSLLASLSAGNGESRSLAGTKKSLAHKPITLISPAAASSAQKQQKLPRYDVFLRDVRSPQQNLTTASAQVQECAQVVGYLWVDRFGRAAGFVSPSTFRCFVKQINTLPDRWTEEIIYDVTRTRVGEIRDIAFQFESLPVGEAIAFCGEHAKSRGGLLLLSALLDQERRCNDPWHAKSAKWSELLQQAEKQ